MKNIYKTLTIAFVLSVITNIAFAEKSALLITASQKFKSNDIDISFELLNEGKFSAVQFEIELPKYQSKQLSTSSCTVNMGGSELAGCSLNGNKLRVGVIESGLGELKTGQIGYVTLKNMNGVLDKKLIVSNAKLIDSKGKETNISAIVDYKNIKIKEENRLEK